MHFGASLTLMLLFNFCALAAENTSGQTNQKSNVQEPKQNKVPQEQKKKPTPPPKTAAPSLKIFKPRERISADNSASFPNDI